MPPASRRHGYSSVPITDSDELELIRKLRAALRPISGLLNWWDRLERMDPLNRSELAYDDNFTAWRHLGSGVRYAVNHSADNLRVIRDLLGESGGPLPMVAIYPVLRAALEGSSLAYWVVGPPNPRDRIHHHLLNAARELFEENTFRKDALEAAKSSRSELNISGAEIERAQRERDEWYCTNRTQIMENARLLGFPDPTQGRNVVGFKKIVGEALALRGLPASYGQITWSQMSGLAHPSLLRAVSTLNMADVSRDTSGTVHVAMSSKVGTVFTAVAAAMLMFRSSIEAYASRLTTPGDRAQYIPPAE